jgi:hypothetical protein
VPVELKYRIMDLKELEALEGITGTVIGSTEAAITAEHLGCQLYMKFQRGTQSVA